MLHDIGKYGCRFQKRLLGTEKGIDHWTPGAWIALHQTDYDRWVKAAIAFCVAGHHTGLLSLSELQQTAMRGSPAAADSLLKWSEDDPEKLLDRLTQDGLGLPRPESLMNQPWEGDVNKIMASMLDVRMLFSTLVDADFIETEAHFQGDATEKRRYRSAGPALHAEAAFEALMRYIERVRKQSSCAQNVRKVREDLLESCVNTASSEPGLFTLTAPTGAGKTLSLLAFALKHAAIHGLRRVVVVIPYLTIIEQTAAVYREVFRDASICTDVRRYLLEDHSLVGTREAEDASGEESSDISPDVSRRRALLAENWDAPIIITTNVQFLESLFSNRPSACRKLHRLAKSVVLLDEAQTLPVELAIPSLAALSHLAHRYGSSVVFSTATQPAFTHLDTEVRRHSPKGWRPREINKNSQQSFHILRRHKVLPLGNLDAKVSWEEVADEIVRRSQVLCIVNLKKHARRLYELVSEKTQDGLFHLSTNMCPEHRRAVLKTAAGRLAANEPCRLISTQCVEAGVDVDFPCVLRAWGPLDAMAQAAGRCNRHGIQDDGNVLVFMPCDEEYPDRSYQQAAAVARVILADKLSQDTLPIHDLAIIASYYRELYDLTNLEKKELEDAIRRWDFPKAAQYYRLIPQHTINVVVPYRIGAFDSLRTRADRDGLTREWILAARPHSIGLFKPKSDSPVVHYLEPVRIGYKGRAEDWFIYINDQHYSAALGLIPPEGEDCLIA